MTLCLLQSRFFIHLRIISRKITSDVYALEITAAEKSVTTSRVNTLMYFRVGGTQTNKLLSVLCKVQKKQNLFLFPKCQEVPLILQFNVKLS